jgi:hypothetical protein
LDATAGAYFSAVECGGGAGEFELAFERPVLQEAVDKAGVEDISGAGGVYDRDAVGGGVEELIAVKGEDAFLANGCGGEAAVVSAVHLAESFFEIGLGHEARGKVTAHDEVVDVGEEIFDTGVEFVEVGDDGNARFAGPGRGESRGGGVVSVDVEGPSVGDPFAVEVGGAEAEASFGVAAYENGSLALGVDENEGLRADCAGHGDNASFDAGVREGFAMKSGGEVVAEFADVAGTQAPVLAGNDGGGDLSAGESADGGVFSLGTAGGVDGERNDRVCCVKSYADKVNLRHFRHISTVNEL